MAKKKTPKAATPAFNPVALARKRQAEAKARREYYEQYRDRLRFAVLTVKGTTDGAPQ